MSKLKPKIVLSRLEGANWTRRGLRPFLEYRDLGLAEATEGRVGGTIGRAIKKFEPGGGAKRHYHDTSFHFMFVMRGCFVPSSMGWARSWCGKVTASPIKARSRRSTLNIPTISRSCRSPRRPIMAP